MGSARLTVPLEFILPDLVVQLIEQPVVRTSAADLHASGICFKCMCEVGVQANEILALPIPVDAAELRRAGFSLDALVRARDLLGLAGHPLVKKPLFLHESSSLQGLASSLWLL